MTPSVNAYRSSESVPQAKRADLFQLINGVYSLAVHMHWNRDESLMISAARARRRHGGGGLGR
jgi:hypothetical protein